MNWATAGCTNVAHEQKVPNLGPAAKRCSRHSVRLRQRGGSEGEVEEVRGEGEREREGRKKHSVASGAPHGVLGLLCVLCVFVLCVCVL